MVPVIFSDEEARHPGEDHGWASETHDTHNLLEDRAVAPVGEGLKDILARRIFTIKKPDVLHAEDGHGVAQFHLAHQPERWTTLAAHVVVSGLSARDVDGLGRAPSRRAQGERHA